VASPTASAAPTPTASPSAKPSTSPSEPPASPTAQPLAVAPVVGQNFVHLDLPGGRAPYAVAQSGQYLWVLDDKNLVERIELESGDIATLATLPRSVQVSAFVAGRARIYALDTRHGDIYMINTTNGDVSTISPTFTKTIVSVAVASDDRLWASVSNSSYLFRIDPRAVLTDFYDLQGAHVSALASDGRGGVYYADDARNAIGAVDPASGRISEFAFVRHGVTTSLVLDGSGTLWLGTSAGEIWSIRGQRATFTVGLQRPVTTLALDPTGRAWYLAPLSAGTFGFRYASADGADSGQTVGGPAFSLAFSAGGRAWLADPRGGFYVSRSGN
jgi:streptogramin lyase